jgi:DNA-binding NarL/FixJ family response regulator
VPQSLFQVQRGLILESDTNGRQLTCLQCGHVLVLATGRRRALERVDARPVPVAHKEAQAPSDERTRRALTEREQQVMQLISNGMGYREVATELGISACTVKAHIANIFAKLGIPRRRRGIAEALRESWRAVS